MGENIQLRPAGQIEIDAGRQEVETGPGERRTPLPRQHGVEEIRREYLTCDDDDNCPQQRTRTR